jgi:hypothetical protein
MIAAEPGWYLAIVYKDNHLDGLDPENCFSEEPIVAWEIERCEHDYHPSARRRPEERCISRHATPITLGGHDINTM